MPDDIAAVHPTALANTLSADELHVRPGEDGVHVAVDPKRARWRNLSFEVQRLAPGEGFLVGQNGLEAAIVTLAGAVEVEWGGGKMRLDGRSSVFGGLPWACYLPPHLGAAVVGLSGPSVVAVAQAPPSGRRGVSRAPILITPDDVRVEIRGAGNATRQINHIVTPEFPADRLLVVEVYTPAGNWSSWPPHKHDVDAMPHEAVLEEVYYYQMARPEGWGIQRLYRRDSTRDALWAVHHGELVLVPDGYHPFVAGHGCDAYYLNALAGDRRTMACTDDPDLAWTRAAWAGMPTDPRVPIVGPARSR